MLQKKIVILVLLIIFLTAGSQPAGAAQEAMQKIIAGYNLTLQEKHEEAAKLFEQAIKIDPMAFNGYTALGYALFELKKYDQAIEAFFKAKELFPHRPEPYNDL
ncbi:MAG: tetratricopeptide repeat protein [Peptococcaceae bacterium]|nr:tetratricopeptide repeat protein [Peptococcaceae bacterium]